MYSSRRPFQKETISSDFYEKCNLFFGKHVSTEASVIFIFFCKNRLSVEYILIKSKDNRYC